MLSEDAKQTPDAWVIESKAGIWLTTKPEIAAKHKNKPETVVVEYYSQKGTVKNAA